MPAPDPVRGETPQQDCFLCLHDTRPCEVNQLEGLLVGVRQFSKDGQTFPYITLAVGPSLASVQLTPYYNSLVKQLLDISPNVRSLKLTMRVLHLPQSNGTTEFKGQVLTRYIANEVTLAILEPDTILNITDLNTAEYCARQYLLNRLIAMPQSPAAVRGNLVHTSFKELLKEYDRGTLRQGDTSNGQASALGTLQHHFEQALEHSSIDLAISNIPVESIRADVAPHLQSLATWFEKQHATLWDMPGESVVRTEHAIDEAEVPAVRAETFLLAPEIGLRGRLDLLWRQRSRQRLLELKTGGGNGDLPKSAHRWQVHGYLSLLAVRRDPKLKNALATLLYSGTPVEATDFSLRFTIKQLQRVTETRNTLVLSHVTGIPAPPPGPSRCTKCSMRDQCAQISALLNWQPPALAPEQPASTLVRAGEDAGMGRDARVALASNQLIGMGRDARVALVPAMPTEADRAFFAKYYELLRLEGLEIERQQALLWKSSMQERIESGMAIGYLEPRGEAVPNEKGEWEQSFTCKNTSELREGDEILLSDGNPVSGEVVSGTILEISSESVKVWMRERINHPTLIDKYATDIVNVRTQQNLLRWLQTETHLQQLVAGTTRPRFLPGEAALLPGLNDEQRLAVERALQMQDYLLIHGPPGTGKTSVIAAIVRQLCARGQRVLLAAFTNQAVDNMLQRLELEGFHQFVRLGHDRSVVESIRSYLPKNRVGQANPVEAIQELLRTSPVIASTTATWSSDKYIPSRNYDMPDFDVAIIDEAGQLTVPAILGALRFAKRFILVGDEQQLPPLVMSEEAALAGLKDALFSCLKRLDNDYTKDHPQEISACISLKVQYRMNSFISHFASQEFYGGLLRPHPSVANRLLAYWTTGEARDGRSRESQAIALALDAGLPMAFLDVQNTPETQPKISNVEARAVRELVAGLLARGIKEKDIGIIAPYKAQVANIRRHLFGGDAANGWQGLPTSSPLTVDTVDRFQGGERAVMILSFATTSTPPAGSQLRKHVSDPNRLNVALTRAQRKLILVGHAHALKRLPTFDRLLVYCRGRQALICYEWSAGCSIREERESGEASSSSNA